MIADKTKDGGSRNQAEAFRSMQEEMLQVSREYSRERLAVWMDEMEALQEDWKTFSGDWQTDMEQMTSLATNKFEEMGAKGAATGNLLAQSWQQALSDLSGEVEDWGENFLQTLARIAGAWTGTWSQGGGAGDGWPSFLTAALDFGGWFHQGGIVAAHQGMVVPPGTLMPDEHLIMAQAGEGILPRESMARLGEMNFEALRTGRFDVTPGAGAPSFDITIQVQSLDAAGVAGMDWDRLVQRHLLPALQNEMAQRW